MRTPPAAEDVLESLTRVIDPDFGINIVDLGLVYGVEVDHDVALITMTLTAPDTSGDALRREVEAVLRRRHPLLAAVRIELVWDPPWRDDFITAEGRRQLAHPIAVHQPADGAGLTSDDILDSLTLVIDPEVGINIVDLGLVYGVALDDGVATIEMTLTTPGCPLHASIEAAVERTLESRHPELAGVDLNLVWEPPWDTDRITAAGRSQLGW